MADVDELGIATVAQEALEAATAGTEALYVSLDIDVVDPAHGGQKYPDPGRSAARASCCAPCACSRAGRSPASTSAASRRATTCRAT